MKQKMEASFVSLDKAASFSVYEIAMFKAGWNAYDL